MRRRRRRGILPEARLVKKFRVRDQSRGRGEGGGGLRKIRDARGRIFLSFCALALSLLAISVSIRGSNSDL
jgi:hypothetical protein